MNALQPFHARVFVLQTEGHVARLQAVIDAAWEQRAASGKPLEVVVSEWKARRDDRANRGYWARLQQIADQVWVPDLRTGTVGSFGRRKFDAETWHEFFKRKLIGLVDLPGGGQAAASSRNLNAEEFDEYVRKVEAHAAQELGVQFLDWRHQP